MYEQETGPHQAGTLASGSQGNHPTPRSCGLPLHTETLAIPRAFVWHCPLGSWLLPVLPKHLSPETWVGHYPLELSQPQIPGSPLPTPVHAKSRSLACHRSLGPSLFSEPWPATAHLGHRYPQIPSLSTASWAIAVPTAPAWHCLLEPC